MIGVLIEVGWPGSGGERRLVVVLDKAVARDNFRDKKIILELVLQR